MTKRERASSQQLQRAVEKNSLAPHRLFPCSATTTFHHIIQHDNTYTLPSLHSTNYSDPSTVYPSMNRYLQRHPSSSYQNLSTASRLQYSIHTEPRNYHQHSTHQPKSSHPRSTKPISTNTTILLLDDQIQLLPSIHPSPHLPSSFPSSAGTNQTSTIKKCLPKPPA